MIVSLSFYSCNHDFTLLITTTSQGCILHYLHINDIIITCDDVKGIGNLKLQLVE